METRKTIGERMLERLKSRDQASPRLDVSASRFEDRFSRYARTRSVSRLGNFLYPDSAVAMPDQSQWDGTGDATWLSSAPYWERMTRLGNARLRRQQRLAGLAARSQQRFRLSAARRLPELRPRVLPFLGLPGLIADQFEVLAPLPQPVTTDIESTMDSVAGEPSRAWQGAGRSDSPWSTTPYTPAKVASSTKKRPLERIVERAPASRASVENVRTAVVSSMRSQAGTTASTAASVQADQPVSGSSSPGRPTPSPVRTERRVRRSMSGRVNPTRSVVYDYEAALPDDFLPPTRHAQGRMAAVRSGRQRGLRPAMSRSPLMAALAPAAPSLAPQISAVSTLPRSRVTTGAGRTTARRTAHRVLKASSGLLSASPVSRPAVVAPSAVTLDPLAVNLAPLAATATPTDSRTAAGEVNPYRSVRRATAAPMVRALARAQAAPEPLIERPLTERRPIASRPVQTRRGVFASETQVLSSGASPVELTEDAAPEAARTQATRSTASANAVERLSLGHEAVAPRSAEQIQGVSRARRPHRLARTAAGTFAPEGSVLAPAYGALEARGEPRSRPLASIGDTAQPPAAAARVAADASVQQRTRRTRPVDPTAVASVLQPVAQASDDTELSQGQHAASRSDRAPTVGRSTTRVVQGFSKAPQGGAEVQQRRSVAPRYARSPLSHIRIKAGPAARVMPSGTPGRVVLGPDGKDGGSLTSATTPREAQTAAQERVERAWSRAGRPLDWTEARIEVIQVPMMTEAAGVEAPRSDKTAAGTYVPVRTGRTRQAAVVPGAPVTLARPEAALRAEQGFDAPGSEGQARTDDTPQDAPAHRRSRPGAWRSGFDTTMGGVGTGAVHQDMPIWAQRSTGRPRIGGSEELVTQLASASAPEDVVQVLMGQGDAIRRATSSLSQPVIQVIQQIKTEAARAEVEAVREQEVLSTETIRARTSRREGVRSSTRVVRGMTGLNPRGTGSRASGQAMDRVSKLAKRLQELIAMTEGQNRSGARQQVRMAEDSGAAKAEGQSAQADSGKGRDSTADIGTLAREVTEQVTRELEMRRERRQEDPDGRSIWW